MMGAVILRFCDQDQGRVSASEQQIKQVQWGYDI